MKSWKEEKSRETSQGAKTLQEASKLHISDYDIDNYSEQPLAKANSFM